MAVFLCGLPLAAHAATPSLTSPAPGSVLSGSAVTFTWSTSSDVAEYQLWLGTTGVGSGNLGVYSTGATTAGSDSAKVSGLPTNGARIYARLFTDAGGNWVATDYVYTASKPATDSAAAALSAVSCSKSSLAGAVTDSCTVSLTAAAPTGGKTVTLSSSNSSLKVPASVTVAAGSSSAAFTASAAAVSSNESVTLKAALGTVSKTCGLTLDAAKPALTASATSLAFGNVSVDTAATRTVTLTSSGTLALTISAESISGSGFTVSGASFPLSIAPGKTATLTVKYDPSAAGAVSGKLNLTSNSSTGTATAIALTGTGTVPALSAFSCTSTSMTGAGTDACTVTLSSKATGSGLSVKLTSSDSAVKVPATVSVASGASTAAFTATVSAVTSAQKATLTAASGTVSKTLSVSLSVPEPALTVSASSLSFGDVVLKTPATQSLVLTSSGTASLTISSGKLTGTGLTMSGVSFPVTLSPNQKATLEVKFDPTAAGAVAGTLTLSSNAYSDTTKTISVSGTGEDQTMEVNLSWEAPSGSDSVSGYNIYRAPSGSSSYVLLNSTPDDSTTYDDKTVQSGSDYQYMVESVSSDGLESAPSNVFTVSVP